MESGTGNVLPEKRGSAEISGVATPVKRPKRQRGHGFEDLADREEGAAKEQGYFAGYAAGALRRKFGGSKRLELLRMATRRAKKRKSSVVIDAKLTHASNERPTMQVQQAARAIIDADADNICKDVCGKRKDYARNMEFLVI